MGRAVSFLTHRNPERPLAGSPICVKFGRTLFATAFWTDIDLCVVGQVNVKALFGVRASFPPPCYSTETAYTFTSCVNWVLILEHSQLLFIICTGAACRLDKAKYEQWSLKPALIDRLKSFRWRTLKRTYGSNQCTKTGDIHENRSFRLQKGSQVCLL